MKTIINNYDVVIIRKNIKNMYLRVKFDEETHNKYIQITCNNRISNASIEDFIKRSQKQIDRAFNREDTKQATKIDLFRDGQKIRLWGKSYTLSLRWKQIPNMYKNYKLEFKENGTLEFFVPVRSVFNQHNKFLNKFYIEEAKRILKPLAVKWETRTGLHANSYNFRFMKSRWGSCNHKTKNITLNAHLAKLDPIFLEYVLLHEIAHLKVPNHGPAFHGFMQNYMIDEKQISRQLNKNSIELL
ncbi:MAG: M48 family metallopeptidase [Coriobacteriales bacterium]|nr:M48 family metallopeptidase [Coriobacteriales bacterium]